VRVTVKAGVEVFSGLDVEVDDVVRLSLDISTIERYLGMGRECCE
jgi:hypothetical protein